MLRFRNILGIAAIAIAATLLSAGSALARDYYDDDDYGYDGSGYEDGYDLSGYEIIIGDTGDRYEGWEDSETHVYVRSRDSRGRRHENYFDSIASAFFVLREKYGTVRILDFEVPEYAGPRHEAHGHEGHGLIDGSEAYYVWDHDRRARGGLPLILAFDSYRDAREEARYRDADVMDFEELIYNLKSWYDMKRSQVYWRGWHSDRWDNSRWNNSWNRRWNGYGWDRNEGWTLRLNIDGDGDIRSGGVRYRNDGVNVQVQGREGDHHNSRGRGRGNGRGNGGRDYRDDDDRRDNDNDDDNKDNSGKYGREKKRERNR